MNIEALLPFLLEHMVTPLGIGVLLATVLVLAAVMAGDPYRGR